ncbi:MAG: hypothetical protein CSA33_08740 [Desulfobulbus propionicus]|nr:MAG: hypothetical protein CSA33_08740 [Desulfobulbus propionicus]
MTAPRSPSPQAQEPDISNTPSMQQMLLDLTQGVLRPGGLEPTRQAFGQCRLHQGARVLDLGCGTGQTTFMLVRELGCTVTALDPSPAMLAKIDHDHPQIQKVRARASALPLADGWFDAVVCECVLSLTRSPQTALQEIGRVLHDQGCLILSDIHLRAGSLAPQLAGFQSCATRALPLHDVLALIRAAGFRLQSCSDLSHHLKQLAAEIIFACGSLQAFWSLFLGPQAARQTCQCLSKAKLGYYQLIAQKGQHHG